MRITKIICLLIFPFLNVFICYAQSDSTLFTYQEYLQNITQFHPLAQKANLKSKLAKAERLAARGNLDPMITANWSQKNFASKLYYQQYQGKLQIPTKLGIDIVAGYQNTTGVFLNPENKTDEFGLWNIGLEVNILQGLIVNERKTALQQAKVFQDLAEAERQILLNNLYYAASVAYLQWQQYEFFREVLSENILIAKTYFKNTKESYLGGEKTTMDTLEAFIMGQDASILFQKNELSLVKVRQNVENYLWYDQSPVTLKASTQPESSNKALFEVDTTLLVSDLVVSHPIILSSVQKKSYVEIGQKLKREKLKPKLKLKYNPLLSTSNNNISPSYSVADFKWGFNFSMPLLFRKQRADVQRGAIKIQEITLDIENKKNKLQNKLEASLAQQIILRNKLILLKQNVKGYKVLLEGENEKFRYGESSVFLLNKRQEKYINGRLKLIKLKIKLQIELLNYLYYSNGLI